MKIPKDDLEKMLSDNDLDNEEVERKQQHEEYERKVRRSLSKAIRNDKEKRNTK